MDEKSKRRIAASLDQPLDDKRDADLVKALENDAQAKAWSEGLKSIDKAMRRWPAPARSAAQWEDFAARLEARLGDAPWESTTRGGNDRFDPLAAPVLEGDDGDSPRVEQKPMSSPDQNDDDDMEALAALTRSSTAPTSLVPPKNVSIRPGPSLHDDAMDDSSGIVDMKQLAEIALKQSAPPPASALAPTKADSEGRADAAVMAGEKPTAKSAATAAAVPAANASAESKAVRAVPVDARAAEPAKKGGAGWVLWLTPVIAAAAAGGFFFFKNNNEHASTNTASSESPPADIAPAAPQQAPATPSAAAPAEPAAPPAPPVAAAAPALAMNDQGAAPTEAAPTEVARGGAPTTPPMPGQAIGAAGGEARAEQRAAENEGGAAPRAHAAPAQTVAAADRTETAPTARTRTGSTAGSTSTTVAVAAPAAQPTVAAAAPAPARTAPATTTASTGAAAGPGGARSMDELMAAAVGPHGSSTGSAAAAASNLGGGGAAAAPSNSAALPERPSRAQVTATLTPFSGAVRACTQGQTGVATVAMVISHDGAVQSASVSGPFSGDANSCITGVVRRAHFPEFTRPSVPIVYPFSIQPPRPGAN